MPEGTQAQVFLPNGTPQSVNALHVRFTEYTVGGNGPEAMPAELPATSSYTYAVELGADEAIAKIDGKDVVFNQPVLVYLENFLDFPVGTLIPVGYYDNTHGRWATSENGRVVKIVGIAGNAADLDTDGDGNADNDLGITLDERQALAGLYAAGQALWRMPRTHFSTVDANWPGAGPPGQRASGPNGPPPDDGDPPNNQDCEEGRHRLSGADARRGDRSGRHAVLD